MFLPKRLNLPNQELSSPPDEVGVPLLESVVLVSLDPLLAGVIDSPGVLPLAVSIIEGILGVRLVPGHPVFEV